MFLVTDAIVFVVSHEYFIMWVYIYSALHKYWNRNDKIYLLAVESRHLQIWLKDEYETKLQNVTFIIRRFNTYMFSQIKRTALLEFIPLIDVSIHIGAVEHKADIKD